MRARQQLQRFFVDPTSIVNNLVKFSDGISHQISQVLRLNVTDDQVIVLDGSGAAYLARLNGKLGRNVTAQIVEKLAIDSDELTDITLCFSLTKREKVEWCESFSTLCFRTQREPFRKHGREAENALGIHHSGSRGTIRML
jgi:16S rRNA U1498 N3-methylase RsmE